MIGHASIGLPGLPRSLDPRQCYLLDDPGLVPLPRQLNLPVSYLVALRLVQGLRHELQIDQGIVQFGADTPGDDMIRGGSSPLAYIPGRSRAMRQFVALGCRITWWGRWGVRLFWLLRSLRWWQREGRKAPGALQ